MYTQSSLRKHHLNYFNHVLELFQPFLSKDFNLKHRNFTDKKNKNVYSSVQFATLSLPCFPSFSPYSVLPVLRSENTGGVFTSAKPPYSPIGVRVVFSSSSKTLRRRRRPFGDSPKGGEDGGSSASLRRISEGSSLLRFCASAQKRSFDLRREDGEEGREVIIGAIL